MPIDPTSAHFEWTLGPPVPREGLSLPQVIVAARLAYERGVQAREVGWLEGARNEFFEATQFNGSEPAYHAALGSVLLAEGHVVEAEAVLSAAVLLAPDSEEGLRVSAEVDLLRQQYQEMFRRSANRSTP